MLRFYFLLIIAMTSVSSIMSSVASSNVRGLFLHTSSGYYNPNILKWIDLASKTFLIEGETKPQNQRYVFDGEPLEMLNNVQRGTYKFTPGLNFIRGFQWDKYDNKFKQGYFKSHNVLKVDFSSSNTKNSFVVHNNDGTQFYVPHVIGSPSYNEVDRWTDYHCHPAATGLITDWKTVDDKETDIDFSRFLNFCDIYRRDFSNSHVGVNPQDLL